MYSKKENKENRQKFWIEFGQKCEKLSTETGEQRKWILYKTGIKGIELKFESIENTIAVVIEINHKDEETRFAYFDQFYGLKADLDKIFGYPLTYMKKYTLVSGFVVSRIFAKKEDLNILDSIQKHEAITYFITKMLRLEKVFLYFKESIDEFNFSDEES